MHFNMRAIYSKILQHALSTKYPLLIFIKGSIFFSTNVYDQQYTFLRMTYSCYTNR